MRSLTRILNVPAGTLLVALIGIVFFGLLISVLFLFKGFSFGEDYSLNTSTFDAKAMNLVEKCSGLKLPSSAKGQNMFYEGSGIDDAFAAKIQVPAENVENLSSQIAALPGEPYSGSLPFAEASPWWKPNLLNIKSHRNLRNGNVNYLELILCEEDGQWYLYVLWFTT